MSRKVKTKSSDLERLARLQNCGTTVIGEAPLYPTPYEFRVPPKPKGRPQFVKTRSGKAFMHTPKQTRQYEAEIQQQTALQHPAGAPYTGDLAVYINFFCESRVHGDLDNLTKAILDAMQGVAFENDKQIKALHIQMFYISKYSPRRPGMTEVIVDRFKASLEE